VRVVCLQVKVSASGSSLVERSPTECDVSKYDHEALIMRKPWSSLGCCAVGELLMVFYLTIPTVK
jgi:hypothetical protein